MKIQVLKFAGLALAMAMLYPSPAIAEDDVCSDIPQLREAAETGDIDSQNDLGRCLMGSGDEEGQAEARRWFRTAMEAGDAEAKNGYAVTLLHGIGGPVDEKEGQRLMEEASAEGSFGAKLSLAEHYLRGGGFYEQDDAKALALLIEAADGDAIKGASKGWVEWRIGMMYLNGRGATKNDETAWQWVVRGADNGAVDAMISRAVMLALGQGTQENDVEAREWYRKAAYSRGKSWPHALRGLGFMHWFGEGGPVDRRKGCAYVNVAVRAGDENAKKLMPQMKGSLSDAEWQTCEKDADDWLKANMG